MLAALDASRRYHESLQQDLPPGTPRPGETVGWPDETIEGIDLRGAVLVGAVLLGTRFLRCCLDDATVHGALAGGSVWDGSSLRGAAFVKAELTEASFVGCDLENARLMKATLLRAVFSGARARGANFSDADLDAARFDRADLTDADLSLATLVGTDLSGARLDGCNLTGALIDPRTNFTGCTGLQTVTAQYLTVDGRRVDQQEAATILSARAAGGLGLV